MRFTSETSLVIKSGDLASIGRRAYIQSYVSDPIEHSCNAPLTVDVPDFCPRLMVNVGGEIWFSCGDDEATLLPRCSLVGGCTTSRQWVSKGNGILVTFRLFPWIKVQGYEAAINKVLPIEDLDPPGTDSLCTLSFIRFVRSVIERGVHCLDDIGIQRIRYLLTNVAKGPIENVARDLGVSNRTLGRLSQKSTGMRPKDLRNIARIRALLDLVAEHNGSRPTLATAATDCGYYDQPHLNRHFSNLGLPSPRELLVGCNVLGDVLKNRKDVVLLKSYPYRCTSP